MNYYWRILDAYLAGTDGNPSPHTLLVVLLLRLIGRGMLTSSQEICLCVSHASWLIRLHPWALVYYI